MEFSTANHRRTERSDYNNILAFLEAVAMQNGTVRLIPPQSMEPLVETFKGSRLFITDAGRLGLSHADCRVGDKVCILNGSKVLRILRPLGKFIADPYANDAEALIGTHVMVGEAHVHGLMYHEEHPDEIKALEPETVYLI